MTPTRPVLRWHGGKFLLADWIIAHFPAHRVYVEPFGGAGSVLLRKARSHAEIYNDLDDEAVNLFRVMRDPEQAARLISGLTLTPFARSEFETSYQPSADPVERARRLVVRSFMGFGSDGATGEYRTGFRANSSRSGTTPAADWRNLAGALGPVVDRLRGVVIEHRDARQVMASHDGPDTLHYCDPPYVHATRSRKARRKAGGNCAVYRHEMSDEDHAGLLDALCGLRGMVVLSGYPSTLYDARLCGTGGGLAQGRAPRPGRWRAGACRSALDQSRRASPSHARSVREGRMSGPRMVLAPIELDEANEFVRRHHRHHGPVRGHKFSTVAGPDPHRVEVLWLNPACSNRLRNAGPLFEGKA